MIAPMQVVCQVLSEMRGDGGWIIERPLVTVPVTTLVDKDWQEELRLLLPEDLVVAYEEWEGEPWRRAPDGMTTLAFEKRQLPRNGEMGRWLHVVNEYVDPEQVVDYVRDFQQIKGEVCWSQVVDNHLVARGNLLALVFEGPARAVWDQDVWSRVCPLTGRRVLGDRTGGNRTEAWMVPSEAKLVYVITDVDEFRDPLEKAGHQVLPFSSRGISSQALSPVRIRKEVRRKTSVLEEAWEEVGEDLERRRRPKNCSPKGGMGW